jgi:adenylate cyclase class 2
MEELEMEVSDFDTALAILTSLGYTKVFRYQKNREVYTLGLKPGQGTGPGSGSVTVLLDETPIGNYLEVEGADRAIGEACELLHLDLGQGTNKNYLDLYREYCERNNLKASDMVFGP